MMRGRRTRKEIPIGLEMRQLREDEEWIWRLGHLAIELAKQNR
jgi:hypothetical protein